MLFKTTTTSVCLVETWIDLPLVSTIWIFSQIQLFYICRYWYAKQLRQTFDVGCVMRLSIANTTRTDRSGNSSPFLPDMDWSCLLQGTNVAQVDVP